MASSKRNPLEVGTVFQPKLYLFGAINLLLANATYPLGGSNIYGLSFAGT